MLKLIVLVVLGIAPVGAVVFAVPLLSAVAVLGLVGLWMFVPSWGPWIYVGICLSLIQWRAWNLYVSKLNLATYVSSPSMSIQNSASVKLAIGAVLGAIRSFVGDDSVGMVMGGLIAGLLFLLQGILFPNPEVILQACGNPIDDIEKQNDTYQQSGAIKSLMSLLEKTDYPTLLKFNRQMRVKGISGPVLTTEFAHFVEDSKRCNMQDMPRH